MRNRSVEQCKTKIRPNNSTGYKGVSLRKSVNKYIAYIKVNGKTIHLGYHTTSEKAAKSYNEAALKHFGEMAYLNKIKEEPMKPQQTITLSNIEILSKDDKSLSYRIIGEDKHYRVSMRDVVRLEYIDGEPVIKLKV